VRHCGRPECVGLNAGQPTLARHGMSLTLQLRCSIEHGTVEKIGVKKGLERRGLAGVVRR